MSENVIPGACCIKKNGTKVTKTKMLQKNYFVTVFFVAIFRCVFLGQKKLLADVTLAIIYKCLHTQHFSFFMAFFFLNIVFSIELE